MPPKKFRFERKAYKPKSRGNCARCGKPVYKSAVRYARRIWHAVCLVAEVREGKV